MRLITALLGFVLAGPTEAPGHDQDLLGDIVVEATEPNRAGPRLMKLAVAPIDGRGPHAELVDAVVRRDLDLSGQFAFVDPDRAGTAEAVVRIAVAQRGATVAVTAAVSFGPDADIPAWKTTASSNAWELRASTHRLVDALMGALTGQRGPFSSRLSFVAQRGDTRSVHVVDADGHGLRRVTDQNRLAAAAATGPDDALYYAASVRHGRFALYREGSAEPLALHPVGSIYGIAFSPDRTQVALTIAVGQDVRLFAGPSDFTDLRPVGTLALTLSPTIDARGRIAVAGTQGLRPRIHVDGRPASPRGASATSPDFCEHPDGTRLVYALGSRRSSDIVVADANGRHARRIAGGGSRHSHPACSPDGRLVAFFSERRSGRGPGLYVMRIDGHHLRKIANVRGHSLQWSRLGGVQQR